ncbi:hypothetical protein BVX97_00620, partial [bacterium E08(2017)]
MNEEIKVECIGCNARYLVDDDMLKDLECPSCNGTEFKKVEETAEPAPEAPQAPAEEAAVAAAEPEPAPAAPSSEKKEAPSFTPSQSKPVDKEVVEDSIQRIQSIRDRIMDELKKVIVGQHDVIEELIAAILGGGHCLLEGVPGLAKTLLISSLSKAMSLKFKRIQFTPDLMPSDITGTEVLQEDQTTGA